jgi:hypothetical protein
LELFKTLTNTIGGGGFTAREMLDGGILLPELKTLSCTVPTFRAASVSASDLREAGFTAMQLKTAGYPTHDLVAAGCSITDLKAAFRAASVSESVSAMTPKHPRREHKNGSFTFVQVLSSKAFNNTSSHNRSGSNHL